MSLILSDTTPEITAKTHGGHIGSAVNLYGLGFDIEISLEDFCCLVNYVLTNTDLHKDDPRIPLVEKIKNLQLLPGYNPGGTRFGE